ncbi:F-box domain-containing protein [Mycena venus]|uniref:F-box domain-containing protein n=1 Tax=Mycena venus TaxID=2733690 RepID=A0A8H6YGT2_9AGAR|nr:F-box domain-containing protein [Mycena venus]
MDPNNRTSESTPPSPTALRTRLSQIDSETEQLDARIDELAAEREPIVEALQTIVYPILTLPTEITSEIFLQHLTGLHEAHDDRPWLVDLHTASHAGPLFLAQVCKAWRAITLSFPSLWCRVRVSSSEQTLPGRQKILEHWLPRAGAHPLYLDIMTGLNYRQIPPLFATLAPYSLQWRTFSLWLTTPISFSMKEIQGRIPLLHKLNVGLNDMCRVSTLITAFSDAPELREVELLNLPPKWISLPWAQLTSLNLAEQDVGQCLEVLSLTPNLEILSVDLAGLPRNSQPTTVRLDHLHTLKVWLSHAKKLPLLAYITLPALKHLHLTLPSRPPIAPLLGFLTRSECKLHSISLYSDFEFAIPALAAMSSISDVSLRDIHWTSSDLASLFCRIATDPTFLPQIRSLSLPNCETAIPYTSLCDMLVARWYERGEQPTIDSFRLIRRAGNADASPNSTISNKLCALVDDGLDINIVSMHGSKYNYYLNYFSF